MATSRNARRPSRERPNILLLFTDQMRADAVGALGNPVIRTPNLDRLCREGTAFTSAYSPSPVCVPARCAMMYGQYPWNTGCFENGDPMPDDRPSFVQRLAEAGYRTHAVGKCHFTPDGQALRGFQTRERQEEIVRSPADDDYLPHLQSSGYGHVCDPFGVRGELYYLPQVAPMPAELHPSQWVADRTIRFVRGQANAKRPWFCFSSYVHPHPPFSPPNPWHKLYRAVDMPLPKMPANPEALLTYVNRLQNRYKYRDQGFDANLLRAMKAYYYACVSFVDHQVGRVLDSLERSGQLDNTLILFSSDHGEHLGDLGCFGKRSMHDASARVPLLARQPGRFVAGGTVQAPASLVDLAPTCLTAAGAPAAGLDGVDLAALADGRTDRSMVFSQHWRGRCATYMAVTPRHKYVYSAPDRREFLFDRVNDPAETRDRFGTPFVDRALAPLREALQAAQRTAGRLEAVNEGAWREYPPLHLDPNPDAGLLIQDHPWADQRIPGYSESAGPATNVGAVFASAD